MNQYTLRIEEAVERQLRHCRASIRASIEKRLQEIVEAESDRADDEQAPAPQGPPLRFYVYESYRISYQVNPVTRSVVLLKIKSEPG